MRTNPTGGKPVGVSFNRVWNVPWRHAGEVQASSPEVRASVQDSKIGHSTGTSMEQVSVLQSDVLENEIRNLKLIRARHETVNRRFKESKIIKNCHRHHESCHSSVIAAITQMGMVDRSWPVFSIGNLQLVLIN